MQLTIFGANGPTGRLLTDLALAEGHDVVAVTRRPDAFPLDGDRLVGRRRRRPRAGRRRRRHRRLRRRRLHPRRAVHQAARHRVLRRHRPTSSPPCTRPGVKRLVAVTSSAMAPHPEPLGGIVFSKVLQPYVVNKLGPNAVRRHAPDGGARRRRANSMWTIVRPSGLCTAATVSRVPRRPRPRRPPLHDAHRPRRLPAARSGRRPPPGCGDRRRDTERQPVDAVIDLARGDPQAVMTHHRDRSRRRPAFDALWRAHRRRMLQLALRMLADLGDAEDVVQEAFARLARTDLASLDDPEGWLVVVTSRLCLDRLRTRRRHPTDPWPGRRAAADAGGRRPGRSRRARRQRDAVDARRAGAAEPGRAHGVRAARRLPAARSRRSARSSGAAPRRAGSWRAGPDAPCVTRRRAGGSPSRTTCNGPSPSASSPPAPTATSPGCSPCSIRPSTGPVTSPPRRSSVPTSSRRASCATSGRRPAPTLLHVPVDDGVGIVAVRDHRVLALVVLTISRPLVVHVEALAGPATGRSSPKCSAQRSNDRWPHGLRVNRRRRPRRRPGRRR